MKTKLNFTRLLLNLLITLFVITASSCLMAQEKKPTDLKDFKIVIEKTKNGIKMQSFKGSAWINLTFSINNNNTQAIDEYGMTTLDQISSEKDANLADFLFTISITENGIALPVNGKQEINQFGMVN